jgi:hypothetical protein
VLIQVLEVFDQSEPKFSHSFPNDFLLKRYNNVRHRREVMRRAWASLHWMVATCSITSAAVFTLSARVLAFVFPRHRAICFACLMKPFWSPEDSCVEVVCDPELLMLTLGMMNTCLTLSDSNSSRHSGHVEVSFVNFSVHDRAGARVSVRCLQRTWAARPRTETCLETALSHLLPSFATRHTTRRRNVGSTTVPSGLPKCNRPSS